MCVCVKCLFAAVKLIDMKKLNRTTSRTFEVSNQFTVSSLTSARHKEMNTMNKYALFDDYVNTLHNQLVMR